MALTAFVCNELVDHLRGTGAGGAVDFAFSAS